jgi:hypothetical protein
MNGFKAMMLKDLREVVLTPTSYSGIVLAITYTVMMITIISRHVNRYLASDKPIEEVVQLLQSDINATTLALTLLTILSLALSVATAAVIFEKKTRTLESLLATPATLPQVWRSKTAIIALSCIPLGTAISLATVFALCQWVVNPRLPTAVWPDWLPLAATLIVIPLAVYFLLDIYVGLQFVISNYRFSSVLFLVLLAGAIALNIVFEETDETWLRYALMALVAIGLWLADWLLAQFVTVERVVLSSKG